MLHFNGVLYSKSMFEKLTTLPVYHGHTISPSVTVLKVMRSKQITLYKATRWTVRLRQKLPFMNLLTDTYLHLIDKNDC